MGLINNKFVDDDFEPYLIENLADNPGQDGMNADDLKKAFDYIAVSVIAPRINEIIDLVVSTVAGSSGAENIGSAAINGLEGTTVHAQIAELRSVLNSALDAATQDTLFPDTVTDAILKQDDNQLLKRFARHAANPASHILSALAEGTASAYTITIPDKTWNDLKDSPNLFLVRTHLDCGISPTLKICDSAALPIRPALASTGNVDAGQMKAQGQYLLMWNPANTTLYLLNPETRAHTHSYDSVTGKPTTFTPATHIHDWNSISLKPATFAPSGHTHDGAGVYVGGSTLTDIYNYIIGLINGKQASGSYVFADSGNRISLRWDGSNIVFRIDASDFVLSGSGHIHDDRYYLRGDVDWLVNQRASASHTHNFNSLGKLYYQPSQPNYDEGGLWLKPI